MLTSLPSMANISSLMFLLYFVYAIVGITLFGATRFGPFYMEDANFRNFPEALLLLFRMSTGENWNEVMGDCQVEAPQCTESGPKKDCGMFLISPTYFSSFFMFGVYLMLNLFIAVILDNFTNCYNKESNLVTTEHLEEYRTVWRKFDTTATGFILLKEMRMLVTRLHKLNNPLVKGLLEKRSLYGLINSEMRNAKGTPVDKSGDPTVNFNRLCESLCVLQMEMEMEGNYLTPDERAMMEDKQRKLKRDVAASAIGAAIRGFLARKRYENRMAELAEERDKYGVTAPSSPSSSPRSSKSSTSPRSKGKRSPRSPRSKQKGEKGSGATRLQL